MKKLWFRRLLPIALIAGFLFLILYRVSAPPSTPAITIKPDTRFRSNPTWRDSGLNTIFTVKNEIPVNNITFGDNALHLYKDSVDYWVNVTYGSNAKINIWKWFQDNTVVLEYTSTGTFITQLYIGNMGTPTVTGADLSSYNDTTKVVQFTTTPASSQFVWITWNSYSFTFHGLFNETTGTRIFDRDVEVTAYFTDGTSPDTFTVNGTYSYSTTHTLQYFHFELGANDREYWLGDTEVSGEIYIFDDTLTTYTFSFLDLAGALDDYPYVEAQYYINGTLRTVEKRKVDVEKKMQMSLVNGRKYFLIIQDGSSYTFGEFLTTDDTTITLTLKGIEFPKETLLTYKYVRIYWTRAFGAPTGNITVTYEDTLSQTNSVEIKFNYKNGTNAYNYTETADSFVHVWGSAENDTDYVGEAIIDHQRYGVYTVRQYFPRHLSTNPWGLDFLGNLPFATNILIPLVIILFVGGCFSTLNAELGAFMACITAIIIVYMWGVPIPASYLIVAFTFAICMALIYAKRRVQT